MPRFQITAPDGRVVVIEGDAAPTDRDAEEIFAALPPVATANAAVAPVREFVPVPVENAGLDYFIKEAGLTGLAPSNQVSPRVAGALVDMGLEGGGATAGQVTGALTGPLAPVAIPVLGGIGGGLGNYAGQKRRILAGEQEGVRLGELLSSIGTGMIPGGPLAASGPRAVIREAGKQAAAGLAAKNLQTVIDEDRLASPVEGVLSSVIPAAGGAAAQKIQADNPAIQAAVLKSAATDALSPKRDTLQAMQKRGAVIVPSEVSSNPINNVLEGIAGPAKVSQAAKRINADVVDEAARIEAGLAKRQPLTQKNLEEARERLAQPYRDVAAISPAAKSKLEEWQNFNADVKDARAAYDLHPSPASRKEAEKLANDAESAFADLQAMATAAGKPGLAADLAQARVDIAKNHSVERALVLGSGNIDPAVLGRELDRVGERGMTGGLRDIAAFQQAFSRDVGNISKVPTVGVSALDTMMGTLLAQNAAKAVGPVGLLSGGLPLIRGPVRSLILSRPYQNTFANLPEPKVRATPDEIAAAIRLLSQAAGSNEEAAKFFAPITEPLFP